MAANAEELRWKLRFYRSTTVLFGILLLVLALVGWQEGQSTEVRRLVFLDALGQPALTLEAAQLPGQEALIIRGRDGKEIMRLGEPMFRQVR